MTHLNLKHLALPLFAAALSFGAWPATAQQQDGLVNVNVSDIDLGIVAVVQVPIGIAANVCGVAVNLLADEVSQGNADCDASVEQAADSRTFLNFAERQGVADDILAAVGG